MSLDMPFEEEMEVADLSEVLDEQDVEAGQDESAAEIRRQYAEVLGLLPRSLEPIEPSPRVEAAIMASLGSTWVDAGTEPNLQSQQPANAVAMFPAPSAWTRWALPIAAVLTLILSGLSVWQSAQIAADKATIERLAGRLSDLNREQAELELVRDQLESANAKLAMATSEGAMYCGLRPVGELEMSANSHGALIVAPDHQNWYLKIEGLEPCPLGRSFQLWFMTGDGRVVSAGTFDVKSGIRVELTAETMPEGTKGLFVTLEPPGGSDLPSGPQVLYGDSVTQLL